MNKREARRQAYARSYTARELHELLGRVFMERER